MNRYAVIAYLECKLGISENDRLGVNKDQHRGIHFNWLDKRIKTMKLVKLFKAFVAPSANEKLARFDAHLLADIGAITTYTRADSVRVPADLGIRLV